MKAKELIALNVPSDCVIAAIEELKSNGKIHRPNEAREWVINVMTNPQLYLNDFAKKVVESRQRTEKETEEFGKNLYGHNKDFIQWGDGEDQGSIDQMKSAMELPIVHKGALMADNHFGYSVPIGGVLGTYNSIIPFAVGVDIACRVRCSITDIPIKLLDDVFSPKADTLIRALNEGTVFGVGGRQEIKENHDVMDKDWNITSITKEMKDKAWTQLGTSGSGNHFVEFGVVTLEQPEFGLETGRYVALLSHSGSRGAGAAVCRTYSDIAISKLPKSFEKFKNLAWLNMDSEAGQEYWLAMNLMGDYASANHQTIHKRVLQLVKGQPLAVIENHHNFAWKEKHDGKDLYVHRKGATPAGAGVLGVIPGSMADPGFIVRGKGKPESLESASHGAGRCMSRTQAIKNLSWADWKSIIRQRGVRVISCGLDEVPAVYKDINKVMAQQTDLVDVIARFDPKIVKMSDDGKSED